MWLSSATVIYTTVFPSQSASQDGKSSASYVAFGHADNLSVQHQKHVTPVSRCEVEAEAAGCRGDEEQEDRG